MATLFSLKSSYDILLLQLAFIAANRTRVLAPRFFRGHVIITQATGLCLGVLGNEPRGFLLCIYVCLDSSRQVPALLPSSPRAGLAAVWPALLSLVTLDRVLRVPAVVGLLGRAWAQTRAPLLAGAEDCMVRCGDSQTNRKPVYFLLTRAGALSPVS